MEGATGGRALGGPGIFSSFLRNSPASVHVASFHRPLASVVIDRNICPSAAAARAAAAVDGPPRVDEAMRVSKWRGQQGLSKRALPLQPARRRTVLVRIVVHGGGTGRSGRRGGGGGCPCSPGCAFDLLSSSLPLRFPDLACLSCADDPSFYPANGTFVLCSVSTRTWQPCNDGCQASKIDVEGPEIDAYLRKKLPPSRADYLAIHKALERKEAILASEQ